MALVTSLIFIHIVSSTPLTSTWAQPAESEQLPSSPTTENFSFTYNYTDLAVCLPECQSIQIVYNSSTNEFTSMGDIVTKKVLNDEEENILKDSIDTLIRRGDFNGAGNCPLSTPYCISSSLTFTVNGETHTAEWSMLSSMILEELAYMGGILHGIAFSNQTQALNVTSAE
jgi:hypothetical protein